MTIKTIQSFTSKECNEFEIFKNDIKIAYYIEYYNNPTVYEIYYDYSEDEFESSNIYDDKNEMLKFIEYLKETA